MKFASLCDACSGASRFAWLGEDVEVVVAGLPDEVFAAGPGEALFDDLDDGGEFGGFGFGD